MEKAKPYDLDLTNVTWQKSSYSNPSGNCVEVARFCVGAVAVRDSKVPHAGALRFAVSQWAAFLRGAEAGHM